MRLFSRPSWHDTRADLTLLASIAGLITVVIVTFGLLRDINVHAAIAAPSAAATGPGVYLLVQHIRRTIRRRRQP